MKPYSFTEKRPAGRRFGVFELGISFAPYGEERNDALNLLEESLMNIWPVQNRRRNLPSTAPMTQFQKMMDQMFEDFWQRPTLSLIGTETPLNDFTPKIDMKEKKNGLTVKAELPGMKEDEIDVSLTRDSLTISGEKRFEKETDEEGGQYYECSYGSFQRIVGLPFEVNPDKVEAKFHNGVLKLDLEKAEGSKDQRKRIQIKSGT